MFAKYLNAPIGHTLKGDKSGYQISFQYVQFCKENGTKTANSWNLSEFKRS
jgi:hypothetical protein